MMLSIEEYIARRKNEDRLDEFDVSASIENMKTVTNYVFEYFGVYLNTTEAEERTALHCEKLDKYRKTLREYDPEIIEWLVNIYAEYGIRTNLTISNILKQDDLFLLCHKESEFRNASYDCYAKLIKKYRFLKEQTEMLFRFIKEYHQAQGQRSRKRGVPFISDDVNEWIEETWTKYGVDVAEFSYDWVLRFHSNDDLWPASHKLTSKESFRKYNYDIKKKNNLFNLDSLYRRMPKNAYTKGKKQEFEILMMHYWLHDLEGDEENYWLEYIEKTLPTVTST